jgi:anthranilate phosphoribosyltransferase
VHDGVVTTSTVDPAALGLAPATAQDLRGGDAAHNAAIVRRVLAGEHGPVRDIVLLNAAAGLISWRLAHDHLDGERDIRERFREQIAVAAEAIDSGAATAKLDAWLAAAGA